MLTLNDGRSELWQWDTGRKLTVDADCSQVHFSNKVFGRSIDVDVSDGVAIIPDILLQTDKDLNVWAFVGTAENGYTKISKTFKVNRRNKPADYVFTPPEQTSLEEIKEKIDYLESIQDPDAIKNAVEDYLERNPVESPVQSVNGQTGTVELTAEDVGAISLDDLQEATNEALTQAKESGEFDGADGQDGKDGADGQDGITPTIGENGNWYLGNTDTGKPSRGETGPQGPQGAPGSGGSGIAVTGATVGQTVKIAAVDDDGVPTAWLPTDFPGGGSSGVANSMRLLNVVEVTDADVLRIDVTETADGVPLADLGITKFVTYVAAAYGTKPDYTNYMTNINGKDFNQNKSLTDLFTASQRRIYCEFIGSGTVWAALSESNGFKAAGTVGFAGAGDDRNWAPRADFGEKLDSFSIYLYGGSFKVGTKIMLWGC